MTKQNIKLKLFIDGEEKVYTTPERLSGKLFRVAIDIAERIESSELIAEEIDELLEFVCDSFGNQFTTDELEEGIDPRDLMQTVYAMTFFVLGQESMAQEVMNSSVDVMANASQLNEW